MKTEREKLISELKSKLETLSFIDMRYEAVADYIISDRRRITKPLIDLGQIKRQPLPKYEELCCAIEDTLKLAEIEVVK